MTDLVQKLGEIAVPDKGRWYQLKFEPQALRQILEVVAEELPELTKRYLDIPYTSVEYVRTISFYGGWLANELRAEANKLEGK
jgi:hypothetical protein